MYLDLRSLLESGSAWSYAVYHLSFVIDAYVLMGNVVRINRDEFVKKEDL